MQPRVIVPLLWGMHFYASRDYMHLGAISQEEGFFMGHSLSRSTCLRYSLSPPPFRGAYNLGHVVCLWEEVTIFQGYSPPFCGVCIFMHPETICISGLYLEEQALFHSMLHQESFIFHGVDSFTGAVAVLVVRHYVACAL